ncbi:MAG: hypothetical protein HZB16_20275 [Armatimonadetes bacterium]|nr:hypothetical protein [Armatimonadota bacterium]
MRSMLLLLLAALTLSSGGTVAQPRTCLGMLPLRPQPGVGASAAEAAFINSLTEALRGDLELAQVGQVRALAWPTALRPDDRPTFETLIELGRQAGCGGVLVLTVAELDFADKTTRLPLVGNVTTRRASLRLRGGLLDVATSAAVANLDQAQKREARGAKGPACERLLREGVGTRDLDTSPMGAVVTALRAALAKDIAAALPRLSAVATTPPTQRADAPADAAFERAQWSTSISAGYGRRDTVAVFNRGAQPRSFIIRPITEPPGIDGAVLGLGAPGEPCTLAPGQYKYVRLVLNAPRQVTAGDLVLGLYSAAAGSVPPIEGAPVDKATVRVEFGAQVGQVAFQVVSQDPLTLAYTCRVSNPSDSAVNGLRLRPDPDDGRVQLLPGMGSNAIHGAVLPAHGSFTFQVVPRMGIDARAFDVKLRGYLGVEHAYEWPLHFELPEGKRMYLGTSHSAQYMSDSFEACVNQGDILLDWGSVDGKMMFKCLDEDAVAPDVKRTWQEWETLILNRGWQWVLDTTGFPGAGNHEPTRAADVRGMTIRPTVAARLGGLERDASDHPMAADGNRWLGLAWYEPEQDGRVAVHFAALSHGAQASRRMGVLRASAPGHEALWPYLRVRRATDQAYLTWEDRAPGRAGDVAFKASGRDMNAWRKTQYLTDHGKGVDDPVVQVSGEQTVGVAWCDLRAGGQVYLRLSQDDGRTFGPELPLPREPGETQAWPQFSFTPGGLQLVWVSVRGAERRIMTVALSAKGEPVGAATVLSRPGAVCGEPQVAANARGDLAAVWREADGAASEACFASARAGGAWSAPRVLSNDSVYSEYPLVGYDDDLLWVTWHGDSEGVADLKYEIRSTDGGASWGPRAALPSLENSVERAWLAATFQLQWPRGSYKPFTLVFSVNDREVGRLANVVPDGTYLFEVPRELIPTAPSRLPSARIHIQAVGCSGAHYLLATDTRLIVRRRFTQIAVAATSQGQADQLADRAGVGTNHDQVDLALSANGVRDLPQTLAAGRVLSLPLSVANLGAKPASRVRLVAYDTDPRDALSRNDTSRLGEVAVGALAPGETRAVVLRVVGRAPQTPQLFVAALSAEPDAYAADNLWVEHFVVGEERARPPLVGTDVPDVLYAPALLPSVQLPNLPALRDLLAQPDLANLLGHANWPMPSLPSINGYVSQALAGLHVPNVTDLFPGLPSVPGVPGLPGLPRLPGLP